MFDRFFMTVMTLVVLACLYTGVQCLYLINTTDFTKIVGGF